MFRVCSKMWISGRMDRLSEYPFIWVRIGCELCPHRKGRYRLARLAAKFGPECPLDELLEKLAFDCKWRTAPGERPPGKYDPKCKARFVDLEGPRIPPDLPPTMMGLRVIRGGKE
jgi:hypothetical protein